MRVRPWHLLLPPVFVAACDSGTGPSGQPTCVTNGAQDVTLAVGAYVQLPPPPNLACLVFPSNASGTDSAAYLLVPHLATSAEGISAAFYLSGDSAVPLTAAARRPLASLGAADRFHEFLRTGERDRWYGTPPVAEASVASPAGPPPVVGSTRQFSVCADLNCSKFKKVTATAKTVGNHLAIYVDNASPANGLTAEDLDTLSTIFDTRLYAVDTAAFGRESDIDGNQIVIVLMTPVVNQLVTRQECSKSGFVAGFFFGADLDPRYGGDSRFNHGEVFYSIVADPDSALSCSHTRDEVKRLVPVTFVHEFQHMISFNQHVLVRGGASEALWLNEGLSHFAEELGGRSFLPGDVTSFSRYTINDLYNAYQYLDSVGYHYLTPSQGIGTLAERGAAWLFVRFLADQFRADTSFAATAAFTRKLVETGQIGGNNVAAATGVPFATLDGRWLLANWVSDLGGFTAPPELRYTSWTFRVTYLGLHNSSNPKVAALFPKPYPLTPSESDGGSVALAGTLKAGSGFFHSAVQGPAGPGFTLTFAGPGGTAIPAGLVPRLAIIRIR